MKRRDLIVYSLIFLLCIGLTSEIVSYQLTGNHLFQRQDAAIAASEDGIRCTDKQIPNRKSTTDVQLKTVSEYEQACKSAFIDDMMLFTNMPISVTNAEMYADKMAGRLREFKAQNIKPIVIVEPDSDWGFVDFQEFAAGNYDEWITAYFKELQKAGIDEDTLGLWIPFPEPQQPYWNNNGNPDDFAHAINRYFGIMRQIFPQAHTGILLDSQVSEDNQASQLLAYTRLIDNKLVDVAGLQGFPWHPTEDGDTREPIISASVFAPAYLLEEVAKSLDTQDVLLNIGSYRHRKVGNGGDIAITSATRKAVLDSIVYESKLLTKADYNITVNIFAENKFNQKEGTDWSYWDDGNYAQAQQTVLFTRFINQLTRDNVRIGIFDARN